MLQGEVEFQVDGRTFARHPGSPGVTVPPNHVHGFRNRSQVPVALRVVGTPGASAECGLRVKFLLSRDGYLPLPGSGPPKHLLLSAVVLQRGGLYFPPLPVWLFRALVSVLAALGRCAPALRDPAEVAAIWDAVLDGTVDIVASDHCGFRVEDKAPGADDIFAAPMGLPGVQTLLPSMFDAAVVRRGLSVPRLTEMLCANPARIFGLYPRKGVVAVGSDADVVLFDPTETWTVRDDEVHHRQRWTPLAGRTLTGRVRRTIRRGETVYDASLEYDRRVRATPGSGRFLARGYGGSA